MTGGLDLGNTVWLCGKVSRSGQLRYTPAGTAVRELLLAVPQQGPEGKGMGYFPILLFGKIAEDSRTECQVGKKVRIEGNVWMRSYRNRQGKRTEEFKIVADLIRGETK